MPLKLLSLSIYEKLILRNYWSWNSDKQNIDTFHPKLLTCIDIEEKNFQISMFFSIIQKWNNCLSFIQFVFLNFTFILNNIVLGTKMMNVDDGKLTYDNEECVIEVLMEFVNTSDVEYEDMPALIP